MATPGQISRSVAGGLMRPIALRGLDGAVEARKDGSSIPDPDSKDAKLPSSESIVGR